VLDSVLCRGLVHLRVRGPRVSCRDARFSAGAQLALSECDVALDGASFEQRSTVTAPATHAAAFGGLARVVSLREARVADLVIAHLDLSACLFAGARGLNRLRIESPPQFATTPRSWRRSGRIPRRWTRRLTIAEEHRWRARHERAPQGWYPPECQCQWLVESDSLPGPADLEADQVGAIYQALREGFKLTGDERAARDCSYGEMDLRRKDPRRPRHELVALWARWLTSGYGLRPTRSVGWLLALVALCSSIARIAAGHANRG
jgi:hypothetical protein